MDIVVSGRHLSVSDEVREQVTERLAAVEKLKDRIIRTEVEFSGRDGKSSPDQAITCEITLRSKGPVVRAEGRGDDKMHAFEKAMDKLKVQLRKASDRRKHHHGLRATQVMTEIAPAAAPAAPEAVETHKVAGMDVTGEGPLVVREKEFNSAPLSLAQALDEMELVGHDFFLYVDAETEVPSVVYRRKGYDYGVIHLKRA